MDASQQNPQPTNEIVATPATTKRSVDYERILKELTKAKEWMTIHWTALGSNAKKPNLREFCETNSLEYVRMINHTYALKKLENEQACQDALDAEIKAFTEKKAKKDAPPAPKEKKPVKCLIKDTNDMECQTDSSSETLSTVSSINPDEYYKVVALDYERRKASADKHKALLKKHNDLLVLLKAQPGWADLVKDFDEDQRKLTARIIVGIPSPAQPKDTLKESQEEVDADIAKKVKDYDEMMEKRRVEALARGEGE